jgi:hypothetical protein
MTLKTPEMTNSGNDRNEIEVSVKIPVPAIFRARDRTEFRQNFEPRASKPTKVPLPWYKRRNPLTTSSEGFPSFSSITNTDVIGVTALILPVAEIHGKRRPQLLR